MNLKLWSRALRHRYCIDPSTINLIQQWLQTGQVEGMVLQSVIPIGFYQDLYAAVHQEMEAGRY